MPPAARVGDNHTCPLVTGNTAHVGGPILQSPGGTPNVLIGGKAGAAVGYPASCTGPPDSIARGSTTVLINGKAAARVGDPTAHGGVVAAGEPTVVVGG